MVHVFRNRQEYTDADAFESDYAEIQQKGTHHPTRAKADMLRHLEYFVHSHVLSWQPFNRHSDYVPSSSSELLRPV